MIDGRSLNVLHVASIRGSDAGLGASDRPDLRVRSMRSGLLYEPNSSINGGSLFMPHGQLKLTLLAICIDIATL